MILELTGSSRAPPAGTWNQGKLLTLPHGRHDGAEEIPHGEGNKTHTRRGIARGKLLARNRSGCRHWCYRDRRTEGFGCEPAASRQATTGRSQNRSGAGRTGSREGPEEAGSESDGTRRT